MRFWGKFGSRFQTIGKWKYSTKLQHYQGKRKMWVLAGTPCPTVTWFNTAMCAVHQSIGLWDAATQQWNCGDRHEIWQRELEKWNLNIVKFPSSQNIFNSVLRTLNKHRWHERLRLNGCENVGFFIIFSIRLFPYSIPKSAIAVTAGYPRRGISPQKTSVRNVKWKQGWAVLIWNMTDGRIGEN